MVYFDIYIMTKAMKRRVINGNINRETR